MRVVSMVGKVCVLLAVIAAPAGAQVRSQIVAEGLTAPVAFIPDPTSHTRFFIVEQGGLIRVLDAGVVLSTPFLDLRASILAGGEQGDCEEGASYTHTERRAQ